MKIGVRKPNVKKSIKARTTGKLKRSVKKSVSPLYGKKGVGFVTDPERSVKNAIYHRTTVGVGDIVDGLDKPATPSPSMGSDRYITLIVICIALIIIGLLSCLLISVAGSVLVVLGTLGIVYSIRRSKNQDK